MREGEERKEGFPPTKTEISFGVVPVVILKGFPP